MIVMNCEEDQIGMPYLPRFYHSVEWAKQHGNLKLVECDYCAEATYFNETQAIWCMYTPGGIWHLFGLSPMEILVAFVQQTEGLEEDIQDLTSWEFSCDVDGLKQQYWYRRILYGDADCYDSFFIWRVLPASIL